MNGLRDRKQAQLHLIKLCVGVGSLSELEAWRAARVEATGDPLTRHRTRMGPKRAAELLDGGSLYWVIKGVVRCRQRILELRSEADAEGAPCTEIVLDGEITPTAAQPRRPFQGWRYLTAADAPADLARGGAAGDALPPALDAAVSEYGVL